MKFVFAILFLMYPLLAFAQDYEAITDAWEPFNPAFERLNVQPPQSMFLDMTDFLISFYKKDISSGSVSRCPYVISCSSFCKEALHRHGVLGLVLFIDRYFYRENIGAFSQYKLVQTKYGVLKLDDGFFMSPD